MSLPHSSRLAGIACRIGQHLSRTYRLIRGLPEPPTREEARLRDERALAAVRVKRQLWLLENKHHQDNLPDWAKDWERQVRECNKHGSI
jgi:hypothetical protein